jgi:hypothetical protein
MHQVTALRKSVDLACRRQKSMLRAQGYEPWTDRIKSVMFTVREMLP